MFFNFKKLILIILKKILPKNLYKNRRKIFFYNSYSSFIFFIKTLKLRILYFDYFYLPSNHLASIYLLSKIEKIFNNQKAFFILWDACLLGVARNQGAIAGSASDIDIAIFFEKKKSIKLLNSLKKNFKVKFFKKNNSIQLFDKLGHHICIDICIFYKKKNYYEHVNTSLTDKKKIYYKGFKSTLSINKYRFHKNIFFPYKRKKMYKKSFFVPNDYLHIVNKIYGPKWKTPNKKNQVYLN